MAGLVAIHEVGILHRDPKPANLMRTRAGLVKLLDIGIAKELGGVTLTAAGHAVGTPEYISPEHVRGHKLDLRTDLYIAGIVVFELLTGVSPFRGATRLAAAHKQVTEMPDLRTPEIPAALVPILGRALAKDRNERYSSARELADALAQVRDSLGRGATAFPASLPGAVPGRGRPRSARCGRGGCGPCPDRGARRRGRPREAAETLVKLGKPAVPTLLEVMWSGKDGLRSRAARTLTRIGAGLAHGPPRAQ